MLQFQCSELNDDLDFKPAMQKLKRYEILVPHMPIADLSRQKNARGIQN